MLINTASIFHCFVCRYIQDVSKAKFGNDGLIVNHTKELSEKGFKDGVRVRFPQAFQIDVIHGRTRDKVNAKIARDAEGVIKAVDDKTGLLSVAVIGTVRKMDKLLKINVPCDKLEVVKVNEKGAGGGGTPKPGGPASSGPKLTSLAGLDFLNEPGWKELKVCR
jgi:hypothetical protein